jgi:hypothetical protein
MIQSWKITQFYRNHKLQIPSKWKIQRKHLRIRLLDGKFVKLNTFENRINVHELGKYCVKFSPTNVYFSLLNYLFPERVGKKYKANYAFPINGEYVVDIDSYLFQRKHSHFLNKTWNVCNECLKSAKHLTIQTCQEIEKYYSDISVVFSGKKGFHIYVHDFSVRDWTRYNDKNPIKCHEVARFKFTKTLSFEVACFDRHHFIVSTDPMRIITVPETLNSESGLICRFIGDRKDLERLSVEQILLNSVPLGSLYGYPEPLRGGDEINA